MIQILIFVTLIFLYALVSKRLERTVITAPIVFTGAGMLVLLAFPELQNWKLELQVFLRVAEIGLVLLLFTDACRTDLQVLKNIRSLPTRLLTTGLLLTILLGMLIALGIFRELSLWEAGILAAILAPTDAGLGQIIVNSPKVPMAIREALNVEAGLNDGLSVPFLLFFIALAANVAGNSEASLGRLIMEQLGYGVAVGIGVGLTGGWLLNLVYRKQWVADSWNQIGVVVLPIFCALISEAVGASMFIAAFVAGLAVQLRMKEVGKHSVEFTEEWGQLFNLAVFFLFGILAARSFSRLEPSHVIYAILSLTVVRILPVAIALRGTRLSAPTIWFMGWFGPRGLASIVLGLVYLEQLTHQSIGTVIPLVVTMTVMLSIFAHGLSALPGIKWYARKIEGLDSNAPERA